jgi:hypothetical protein
MSAVEWRDSMLPRNIPIALPIGASPGECNSRYTASKISKHSTFIDFSAF